MTSNPFEPLTPRPEPPQLKQAPGIAYGVALMAALASLIGWSLGTLYAFVSYPELFADGGWLSGSQGVFDLVHALALAGLMGLMTTRFWFERKAIAAHQRPGWLLAGALAGGVLVQALIALLLYGGWFALESGPLEFLDDHTAFLLFSTAINGLTWLLSGPLLLLVLFALSRGAMTHDPLARAVPRWEMALCFGLSIALLLALLFDLLGLALQPLANTETRLALLACALAAGMMAIVATWRLIPTRGRRLRPVRLLWSSLICVLLWMLVSLLLGALLVLVALFDEQLFLPVAVLLAIVSLALLVLLSRFCLRFIYRPRPG